MKQAERYSCVNISVDDMPRGDDAVWDAAPPVHLSDTQTGETPFLLTELRIMRCDTQEKLLVRFSGEDDEVLSIFRLHDAPLYRQDVFELFIADTDDLYAYKELESSPYDIHFDGTIIYREPGKVLLNLDWDIKGWQSKTVLGSNRTTAVWSLPYSAFATRPKAGSSWRFNAFRVDHHSTRGISLQAWQPTLQPTFHVPDRFGYLDFVD